MTAIIQIPSTSLEVALDPAYTVKQSVGGSVCVTGDPVGEWQDFSSNARHVAQSTPGAKPVWRESVSLFNGRPGVEFSTDDYLSLNTSGIFGNLNAYTWYIKFFTSQTNGAVIVNERSTTSSNPAVQARLNTNVGSGGVGSVHRDNSNTAAATDVLASGNNGAAHLLVVRRSASNRFDTYLDGSAIGSSTGSPSTTSPDRFSVGAAVSSTVGSYVTGTLGIILLFSADNYSTTFSSYGNKTISQIINEYYSGGNHLIGSKLMHPLGRRLAA